MRFPQPTLTQLFSSPISYLVLPSVHSKVHFSLLSSLIWFPPSPSDLCHRAAVKLRSPLQVHCCVSFRGKLMTNPEIPLDLDEKIDKLTKYRSSCRNADLVADLPTVSVMETTSPSYRCRSFSKNEISTRNGGMPTIFQTLIGTRSIRFHV